MRYIYFFMNDSLFLKLNPLRKTQQFQLFQTDNVCLRLNPRYYSVKKFGSDLCYSIRNQ